jgi:hypothetical protein
VHAGQTSGRGECLVVDVECGSHVSSFTERDACIKKASSKGWKNFLFTVADTHKRIGTIDAQVSDVVTSDYYGSAPVGRGAAMRPKDQYLFAWVYGDDAPFVIA